MSLQVQYNRGFTLLETIITISIVSVISVLVIPFFSRFLIQNALMTSYDTTIVMIRKAYTYSYYGRNGSNWGIYNNGNTLIMYSGNSYLLRTVQYDETVTLQPKITISGLTEVNFTERTGAVGTAITFTVNSPYQSKTIIINKLGQVY
ncbi:MAG: prepilin-type N-terminal cleavage/methylation domain-containing protein [Candidatus Roizmanbacteria bacterium]